MPHPAEHHGHTALVGSVYDLLVTHGATGLNDAGGTGVHHHVQAIAKRKKRVAGHRSAHLALLADTHPHTLGHVPLALQQIADFPALQSTEWSDL